MDLEIINCEPETKMKRTIVLAKRVESRILVLRGQRVILDANLAELYSVAVKRLNEQVKRNAKRFPADFRFRLTREEQRGLRSHFATSNPSRGGRRYLPYAFTEHGAIMAATVLNSERAIQMSVFVVRAFVRMRLALAANQEVMEKPSEIEGHLQNHDTEIEQIIEAIREMMTPPAGNRRHIGFEIPEKILNASLKRSSRRLSG